MDVPDEGGVLFQMPQQGPYRRDAGTPGNHHQMFPLELFQGPALSVGPPQEQHVARLLGEDAVRHPADRPDGKFQPSLSLGGNGDRRLAHLGDGELHELAVLGFGVRGDPEGPLVPALPVNL